MTRLIIMSINAVPDISTRDNIAKNYCQGLAAKDGQDAFVYYDDQQHKVMLNIMARNGFLWRCDVKRMYQDKDSVKELLVKLHKVSTEGSITDYNTTEKLLTFTNTVFRDAMEQYCILRDKKDVSSGAIGAAVASRLKSELKGSNIWKRCEAYYNLLGADRIKALSYQESKIKKEAQKIMDAQRIQLQVDAHYHDKQRIEKSKLKEQLQSIYDSLGLKVRAKATDIEDYGFECTDCKMTIDGKRVHGYELKKKQY